MPNKPKSSKVVRPAGGKPKAKVKLWVLWEPPAQVLVVTVVAAIFASAGLIALRFGNANAPNQQVGVNELLWQDKPDSAVGSLVSPAAGVGSPLQNWRTANDYVYGGATIRVVEDETKGKAIEYFGVANGGHAGPYGQKQRAEQIADLSLKKESIYWFGFDLLVAGDGGVTSGRQVIWQVLPQPDKSPAKLWLAVNTNEQGLVLETETSSLRVGALPDKQWSRLVLGVHVDDDNDAWFEVWRDGQLAVPRQQVAGGVLPVGTSTGAMSAGLYRSPEPWDLRVRMANVKIGSTQEAVQ